MLVIIPHHVHTVPGVDMGMPNIKESMPTTSTSWAQHCGLLSGLGMEVVLWALLSSSPSDLLTKSAMEVPSWVDPAPTGGEREIGPLSFL